MEVAISPVKYFKKAKFYFRLSLAFFLYTATFAPIWKQTSIDERIQSLLIGLPAISTFFLIPIGFYHLIKSFRRKESSLKLRRLYLLGYTIFLFLLLSLIVSMIKDFDKLFGQL